tara:strand:+ start:23979 stop:25100 length:1122 start_codon:yes stop_codon:yes gene_type:complete
MLTKLLITFAIIFTFISASYAQESDLKMKYVNQEFRPLGYENLQTQALLPTSDTFNGGFNKLIDYVLPSPYQENAGSCLFMSHTGVIETILNKKSKGKNFDLSERYLMNLAKANVGSSKINNWRTDTIFRSNETRKAYFNKDFRYTKGHYKIKNGTRIQAHQSDEKAIYGIKYNWVIAHQNIKATPIKLPTFSREILFADKDENQWNVNVAPKDIVKKIKAALVKRESPVLVIYNHHGFWHANFILGFNDNASSDGCKFVSTFKDNMYNRATEIDEEAREATSSKEKRKLERKAAKFRSRGLNVDNAYHANGGCRERGVFYVRDSIYPQENMPLYDYDKSKEGEEKHLNAPIIVREYEWVERLANHVIQIYAN